MGNCQAIDAASLVIQHPGGRVERMYWPVSANEVMKMNSGHYVALIIKVSLSQDGNPPQNNALRFTRIKLLRPTDTLVLGQAYRLITSQEVMKGLWEKKYAKMKQKQQLQQPESESAEKPQKAREMQGSGSKTESRTRRSELEKTSQVTKHERHRQRTTSSNSAAAKSRSWRPSLQSISEAAT